MALRLGLDARLYRNTGSYASPTWNFVQNVKDLTLNLEVGEADVSTRGTGGLASYSLCPQGCLHRV